MASASTNKTSKVKAWKWTTPGYPESLQRSEDFVPTAAPTPTSIVVRIRSAALNPVDIQIMNFRLFWLPGLSSPKVPCKDFAGEVLVAGSASGYAVGDSVFGMTPNRDGGRGTLTEAQVLDTAAAVIQKKPASWSFPQAAAVPLVWLTARTIAERVAPWVEGVGAGGYVTAAQRRRVVVLGGSSATGMYVVLLVRKRGWEVLSTCSARNTEFVKGMGAAHVVDYTTEDVAARVKEFGPAAIVDCVGGTTCLGLAPRYVTIVGDKTSRDTMGGPLTYLWSIAQNWRWLAGRIGWGGEKGEVYDNVMLEARNDWLAEATTTLTPDTIHIDTEVNFDDVKNGFDRLHTGRARGKVVVKIQ